MLLGYGDEVPEIMIKTELFYYVEQDTTEETQQTPEETQGTPEETQGAPELSDEELAILF